MGLRFFGGLLAVVLAVFALLRYRKGLLRRGEIIALSLAIVGVLVAAGAPQLFDPFLSPLGLHPGDQRRLVGVLMLSNLFTLALVFRGFTREDQLSKELGDHVDLSALRRFEDDNWKPRLGACAVVIPAFNEGDSLPGVLTELPSEVAGMPVDPIVVADGCTDNTEDVARRHGAVVIRRELRRGQGAAVRLGYIAALRRNASLIVTMDADGQHDPREMERLIEPLRLGMADLVQGSRTLGSSEVDSTVRANGVKFFARVVSGLGRIQITDPSNGYRAVIPDALRRLDLRQDQFFTSELILDAVHKKLRVVEVPITVRRRFSGATKKGTTFRYAWGFGKTMVGTWLRQRSGANGFGLEPRWLSHSRVAIGASRKTGEAVTETAD